MRDFSSRFLLRSVFAAVLACGAVHVCAAAQDAAGTEEARHEEAAPQGQLTWKIVNTTIFAILLGWGIARSAPRFFAARSADIQKAIKDATGLKIDADFRYSAIDRKLATLGDEVQRMRSEFAAASEQEHRRILTETESERQRIQHHVEAEIEGLRAESIYRLRQDTAQRAFSLAEQALQQAGPAQEASLVSDLIHLVEKTA